MSDKPLMSRDIKIVQSSGDSIPDGIVWGTVGDGTWLDHGYTTIEGREYTVEITRTDLEMEPRAPVDDWLVSNLPADVVLEQDD